MVKYVILSAIPMVPFQRNEVEIWSFRLRSDQKTVETALKLTMPLILFRTHVKNKNRLHSP